MNVVSTCVEIAKIVPVVYPLVSKALQVEMNKLSRGVCSYNPAYDANKQARSVVTSLGTSAYIDGRLC